MKNKLLTNFVNKKDLILKEELFHTNYKKYRNLLSTLIKKSKQAYYDEYFERNWNNIENTWKGIKFLISVKTVASNVLTVLSLDNGDTITSPYDIANTFNNYFASIAETTKKSIKYSHKHFSDYLFYVHVWYFSFLKIAKVVPVFKKDSMLDYSNYLLSSNLLVIKY